MPINHHDTADPVTKRTPVSRPIPVAGVPTDLRRTRPQRLPLAVATSRPHPTRGLAVRRRSGPRSLDEMMENRIPSFAKEFRSNRPLC